MGISAIVFASGLDRDKRHMTTNDRKVKETTTKKIILKLGWIFVVLEELSLIL
jgi:hypothetical protein